jgi:DNA topoisomerase IA
VSPELSPACGNGAWLTAGRVQSVALRIVADRELEILNFRPKDYVEVYLHFNTDNIRWKAKWIPGDLLPEVEKYGTNRAFAQHAADIRNVIVTSATWVLMEAASRSMALKPYHMGVLPPRPHHSR